MIHAPLVVHAELVVRRERRQRAPGLVEDATHPLRLAKAQTRCDATADGRDPRFKRVRRDPPVTGSRCRRHTAGAAVALSARMTAAPAFAAAAAAHAPAMPPPTIRTSVVIDKASSADEAIRPVTPPCGRCRLLARTRERLGQVRQDVVGMLDADRETNVARRHAGGELLIGGELLMRGRGRMDGERARIADVGDVIEQLQLHR